MCLVIMHQYMGQVELSHNKQQDDKSWRPAAYFSRALINIEAHYSLIEKEFLGFIWVCERESDCILFKNVGDFNAETKVFVCSVLDAIPVSDIKLRQIIDSQDQDEVCKTCNIVLKFGLRSTCCQLLPNLFGQIKDN